MFTLRLILFVECNLINKLFSYSFNLFLHETVVFVVVFCLKFIGFFLYYFKLEFLEQT